MNWQPVIIFYVKTTAWVVLPLVIGLIVGNFTKNQMFFFISLMVGFFITCFGIYREVKQYKKQLEQNEKDKPKNGNK